MATYTLDIPRGKTRLFRSMARELGATMVKPMRKAQPESDSSRTFFNDCLSHWKMETMFASSPEEIIGNEYFKAIVDMGTVAVPFIAEELKRKPSHLVWALNAIYGTKISDDPQTTISKACELWLERIAR